MALKTSFLPHFPHLLQGKPKPSSSSILAKQLDHLRDLAFPDLQALLSSCFPSGFFLSAPDSKPIRKAIYTPITLFWAFLYQTLNPGLSCQGVVSKVRAWLVDHPTRPKRPSLGTSAFCLARKSLSIRLLQAACDALRQKLAAHASCTWLWCGREVKVIDGSSVSMPDTAANQQRWPQPSSQKPGCGFPVASLLGIFCLSTGAWLGHSLDTWNRHDMGIWGKLRHLLKKGDVLLGDAGFCAWALMAELKQRGCDSVFRLHQRRPKDLNLGRKINSRESIQTWPKPGYAPKSAWSKEQWQALPEELEVRVIQVEITQKGFRTKTVWIATTLCDTKAYPTEEVMELYRRRWSIELFFRDTKTTMGMEVLRCKTPEMIEKEILMHVCAYNAIRMLIMRSALTHHMELGRISFKGALGLIHEWLPRAGQYIDKPLKLGHWTEELLTAMAKVQNSHRPNRQEPRAKKRRGKSYQNLTKPRHEFKEIPHRERYRKSA